MKPCGKTTEFGFEWGAANVRRLFSRDGWVTIGIDAGKNSLQIYVTKTGKIRIHDENGEWKKPAKQP